MFRFLRNTLRLNENEDKRQAWLEETLGKLPPGFKILDAGAGELRNKNFCAHLSYVSQDFNQYEGIGNKEGLQTGSWDTSNIDIISDIKAIPEDNESFDAILCSEVFEHVPDPTEALKEFSRLLKPGGTLITTAPFSSLVHFAPYHFCSGFSRYWYEYHLPNFGFEIIELTPNGDWFSLLKQEIFRFPIIIKNYRKSLWIISIIAVSFLAPILFLVKNCRETTELACFGWHCVAKKK